MKTIGNWPAPPQESGGPLQLTPDRVDCWFVSLAGFPAHAESCWFAILSRDEKRRAADFYFEHQRHCYMRSHVALRLLLGRYLMTAPEAVAIVADTHGRPALVGSNDLEFNLSHSGDAALVGVSLYAPVGVDLELVRDVPDIH